MASKATTKAVAYFRTSSATNVGADRDSLKASGRLSPNLANCAVKRGRNTLILPMLVPENCAGRPLSPRERQCLALAACSKTLDEIAMILGLSHSSVRVYLDMARRKLDAVNLTRAVAVAIAFGHFPGPCPAGLSRVRAV